MENKALPFAIEKLGAAFAARDWAYLDVPSGSPKEKTYAWPGGENEEIMICVHKGPRIQELFHRQDFFFFNFAYKGDYGAISYRYDNHITVREGECYIGQPHAGYALYADGEDEIIIVGVLIRKDTFFRAFLPGRACLCRLLSCPAPKSTRTGLSNIKFILSLRFKFSSILYFTFGANTIINLNEYSGKFSYLIL